MSRLSSSFEQQHDGSVPGPSGSARTNPRQLSRDMGDPNGDRLGDKTGEGHGLSWRKHRNQAGSTFRIESPGQLRNSLNSGGAAQQSRRQRKHESSGTEPKEEDSRRHHHRHQDHHRPKSSLGSSPLGKEVANASPAEKGSLREDASHTSSPNVGSSGRSSQPDLDKDTAQIVNLALNLSESRRRSGSGKSFKAQSQRERRTTSTSIPHSSAWDTRGQTKHRYRSWQFGNSVQGNPTFQASEPFPQAPAIPSSYLPGTAVPEGDEDHEFSDATLARAENARRHFELFMEYLRLLPLLPQLHVPTERRASLVSDTSDEKNGRAYNPLQYIRNRKVRYRERAALNTESAAWEDSAKIHTWVDNILASHDKHHNRPDICLRLPPVEPGHRVEATVEEMSPSSPGAGYPYGHESKKPRRPPKDWMTSPSSLLADAAWLEQDSNKLKIEDREGNKVFPPNTEFKIISSTGASEEPETLQNQDSRDESATHSNGHPPNFSPAGASHGLAHASRGRRRQRFAHSLNLTPSHSHSRMSSRSRWRKALSRSSSTSSLDLSDDAVRKKRLAEAHADAQDKSAMFSAGPEQSIRPELRDSSHFRGLDTGPFVGAPRENDSGGLRPFSRRRTRSIASSSMSDNREGGRRSSIEELETAPNSPTHITKLPNIATDLTPAQSQPTSPRIGPQPLNQRHKQSDEKSPESEVTTDRYSEMPELGSISQNASPIRRRTGLHDRPKPHDFRRTDTFPAKLRKGASNQESKIRGMFKGGRIAELVGSEVSKVGDFILKRDPGHSRQSSSASSVMSEYLPADGDVQGSNGKAELHSRRASLQRNHSDTTQYDTQRVSSPPRARVEHSQHVEASEKHQPPNSAENATDDDTSTSSPMGKGDDTGAQEFGDKDKLKSDEHTSGVEKVTFRPTNRGLEPVIESPRSGLLQRNPSRPKLSEATRNWSMSSHSITRAGDSFRVGKRDIAAVRAHLLSSGTKALQICRKCERADGRPWSSNETAVAEPNSQHLSAVTSRDAIATATNMMGSFDKEAATIRQSMSALSRDQVPYLISDLERLETLISSSLTPRMRATNVDADALTSELATTSTLYIKQLNDALDRGIRKRNRRFRRVSRLGFVILEWCLVGAMWFVWMIVMVLKVTRGIWRGTVSGVRWILWL